MNENKPTRERPAGEPDRRKRTAGTERIADPKIHDGAAQAPGGPEPGDDPRQGHRSQKNSI